jgi:signal transduction histidine kinase
MMKANRRVSIIQSLLHAQESDRKRIAADLHDGLGQCLTLIKNRALVARSDAGEDLTMRSHLDEILSLTDQSLVEVRAVFSELRPARIDRFGLKKALHHLVDTVERQSNVKFTAEIDEMQDGFTPEVQTVIYRIVQESVTNILRHSCASSGRVSVQKGKDSAVVVVQDDGLGFDALGASSHSNPHPGGLIGMQERVRGISGKLIINSVPGRGTTVLVRIPYGS